MERPKGSWQPPARQVTGEMLYVQALWQDGKRIGYYSELPDEARQEFESAARAMAASGEKPEILKLYEQHDVAPTPVSISCCAFAEALLKLEDSTGETPHTRIELTKSPDQVLAELQGLQAGRLLTDANEQLALPGAESGSYQGDLKKSDMMLMAVSFDVWQQDQDFLLVNKNSTAPKFPDDYVPYVGGEKRRSYTLNMSFEYLMPDSTYAIESLALNIDASGGLRLFRNVETQAYERAGLTDYMAESIENPNEAVVTEFVDFLARIVGDNPETELQQKERGFRQAIEQFPKEQSKAYVKEWIVNTDVHAVRMFLNLDLPNGGTMLGMLTDPRTADEAHDSLMRHVERLRRRRQEFEAEEGPNTRRPWQDLVQRD